MIPVCGIYIPQTGYKLRTLRTAEHGALMLNYASQINPLASCATSSESDAGLSCAPEI